MTGYSFWRALLFSGRRLKRIILPNSLPLLPNFASRKMRASKIETIRPYFDASFYLDTYPDVGAANVDPLNHYDCVGWREHRDPSPEFSTSYYLKSNPDIASANVNPYWHYIVHGRHEGRAPTYLAALVDEIFSGSDDHEEKISLHFEGRVKFASNEIIGDTLVVLLFTNRSGSNLLADCLISSGHFTGLQELLNWDFVVDAAARNNIKNFPQFIRSIYRHNQEPGRLFGLKASAGQLMMLYRWGALTAFKNVKLIRIERRDLVAQAVSLSIARQTRQWSSRSEVRGKAEYRETDIISDIVSLSRQLMLQNVVLSVLQLPYISVAYEDLVAEPMSVVSKTLGFFGLPERVEIGSDLKRQASELNDEYSALVRAQLRDAFLRDLGAGASEQSGMSRV